MGDFHLCIHIQMEATVLASKPFPLAAPCRNERLSHGGQMGF